MVERIAAIHSARRALDLVGKRLSANPAYGVYLHADRQLRRVLEQLRAPLPEPAELQWLDIGLMAARELETSDPEPAAALMDADRDFRHAT